MGGLNRQRATINGTCDLVNEFLPFQTIDEVSDRYSRYPNMLRKLCLDTISCFAAVRTTASRPSGLDLEGSQGE